MNLCFRVKRRLCPKGMKQFEVCFIRVGDLDKKDLTECLLGRVYLKKASARNVDFRIADYLFYKTYYSVLRN